MSFRHVMVRWRFITFPGLLLAPLLGLAAALLIAREYQATSTVIMLGPNPPVRVSPSGPAVRPNPFLGFGSSLDVSAELILRIMTNDPTVRQRMHDAGATALYSLSIGAEGGPMINVVATSHSPAEALRTVAVIDAGIQDVLVERQSQTGAPPETWIHALTIATSDQATLALASPIRAFLAVVVVVVAAVVGLAYLLQAILGWPAPPESVAAAAAGPW